MSEGITVKDRRLRSETNRQGAADATRRRDDPASGALSKNKYAGMTATMVGLTSKLRRGRT